MAIIAGSGGAISEFSISESSASGSPDYPQFTASLALAPAIPIFSFTDVEAEPVEMIGPISSGAISSGPVSGIKNLSFAASMALSQPASSIAINEAEDFIASLALTPAIPVFAFSGVWFSASIALTQPADSITFNNYNGVAPWQAATVDNTRRRQANPTLQAIRQTAPTLKQTRQTTPALGD